MASATSSDYLYTAQLTYLLKSTATTPPAPATTYIALLTTTPADGLDGVGLVEVSGGSYARQPITYNTGWTSIGARPNLEISNAADITFPVPTANWGTITGAALYDAVTGGNLLYIAHLSASKNVVLGDGAPKILMNQLKISRATC